MKTQYADFGKSTQSLRQIWIKMMTNTHKDYDKSTSFWKICIKSVTNLNEDDDKSTWILWQKYSV